MPSGSSVDHSTATKASRHMPVETDDMPALTGGGSVPVSRIRPRSALLAGAMVRSRSSRRDNASRKRRRVRRFQLKFDLAQRLLPLPGLDTLIETNFDSATIADGDRPHRARNPFRTRDEFGII
jgi:hypothetical protein